ncbi:MAG: hypothetical protein A2Y77_07255 [Planctomycetes bacterium RBG_13_62_9]|nr:MAG: hypothetical protein A2Y77_07255 [Planctomycetes bacterium RBG_13_62_9]
MLRSVRSLRGFGIGARDGVVGKAHCLLFDDGSWAVRYLVVDTGGWLPGRKVLIAATALERPDWHARIFPVGLTRRQIENSPDIDTDKPVSRQREIELHDYYNWVPYWGTAYGAGAVAAVPLPKPPGEVKQAAEGDSHLRSTREVAGYRIHATDGAIGHVEDFIVSEEDWVIRYLVVDTRNWLPGRSVLISPEWVREIGWEEQQVWVDVSRQAIEDSPPYDASAPVNREYEVQMYDYYGRPKYWA